MGVDLSIDDFGTGYSSLAYLKRLPVNELKIDKSFVLNMENDVGDTKIVRSTIDLGHNMGLRVVAEGHRERGRVAPAGRAGLRPGPGLLHEPPDPRRPADSRGWRRGRRRPPSPPPTPATPNKKCPGFRPNVSNLLNFTL
jgi:EAL domain-containing protein (putative c-di-GMP-specific phosphodiesterase class I)